MSWPYLAALAGWARYDRVAVVEVAASVIGNVSMLTAAALFGSVPAFLWAQVVAVCGAVLASRQMALPLLRNQNARPVPLASLFREATPFASSMAVQSFYTRLDIVLLGQFSPGMAVGLYSVAYKAINVAVFFGSTIGGTLLPLMAQARRGEVPVAFARAMRALGIAAPAMALAAMGLASPMLRLLFGAEYAPAAPILGVLAWSAAANWLYTPLAISLQAKSQERCWLAALLVGLCLNAAGNLWAIPKWGGIGAAAATLSSEIALLGFGVVFVWRRLSILPHWRIVLPTLCAAVAGSCCLGILRALAFGPLAATVASLCLYGALLVGFAVIRREDVALVAGWTRQAVFGEARS
jgi:O-antigen/teichoic acid export membrane protein